MEKTCIVKCSVSALIRSAAECSGITKDRDQLGLCTNCTRGCRSRGRLPRGSLQAEKGVGHPGQGEQLEF